MIEPKLYFFRSIQFSVESIIQGGSTSSSYLSNLFFTDFQQALISVNVFVF